MKKINLFLNVAVLLIGTTSMAFADECKVKNTATSSSTSNSLPNAIANYNNNNSCLVKSGLSRIKIMDKTNGVTAITLSKTLEIKDSTYGGNLEIVTESGNAVEIVATGLLGAFDIQQSKKTTTFSNLKISADSCEQAFLGVANSCSGYAETTNVTITPVHDEDDDGYLSKAYTFSYNLNNLSSADDIASGDCKDDNAAINPGATENTTDGIDNNCNGNIDEGGRSYDDDGDGYTETEGDCNDGDASINPNATDSDGNGVDDNCDGVKDEGYDGDGDGYSAAAGDCDDADSGIHPGATESADAIDNNCDGTIDEGTDNFDDDADGYCETPDSKDCHRYTGVTVPSSYAVDCNDDDATIHPNATEIGCNNVDDNCSAGTADPTGLADDYCAGTGTVDADKDGYFSQATGGDDCDDNNTSIHPDATELYNTIDDDCDGLVDDSTIYYDDDGDGYCELTAGTCIGIAQPGDCNDDNAAVLPKAKEIYDSIDNNCDGIKNESTSQDADGDGFAGITVDADGTVHYGDKYDAPDCNDSNAQINPDAIETTGDNIDFNCDGNINPVFIDSDDDDGDGYAATDGAGNIVDCNDNASEINPGATEIPSDDIDSNCDGVDGVDADLDGHLSLSDISGDDCDDADPTVYAGAPEFPGGLDDGKDNDCDGAIDEVDSAYVDADRDNFPGTNADGTAGVDCDDTNPQVNPGMPEIPDNGADDNCSGEENEESDIGAYVDADGDRYAGTYFDGTAGPDCNDGDASIYPGAPEFPHTGEPDGVDNDCDGSIDETECAGDACSGGGGGKDEDGDGYVSIEDGGADCNDQDAAYKPDATVVDYVEYDDDGNVVIWLDYNCDGTVNGACLVSGLIDTDCDGIADTSDNCDTVKNRPNETGAQPDYDDDAIGDACDLDPCGLDPLGEALSEEGASESEIAAARQTELVSCFAAMGVVISESTSDTPETGSRTSGGGCSLVIE